MLIESVFVLFSDDHGTVGISATQEKQNDDGANIKLLETAMLTFERAN